MKVVRNDILSNCLGLLHDHSVIDTIKEYGRRGTNFYCTCRLEGRSGRNEPQSGIVVDGSRGLDGGVSKQAMKQLFETVKNLCAAVYTLTNNMKHVMETVGQ